MKNRKPLIIFVAIIIITVLFISLWISGIIPKRMTTTEIPSGNITTAYTDTNSSITKLPQDIRHEISYYQQEFHFSVNKWEFDPVKSNEINLYAHDIRNVSLIQELQGKQIGNYTIQIIHDTEFETTRSEVESYLSGLMKNPEYKITNFGMVTDPFADPTGQYAELYCTGLTPANKKLDNTIIKGWKIKVYPMTPLPNTPVPIMSSSND